jgi:hypothetical protein
MHLSYMPVLPWRAWRRVSGLTRLPYQHSEAQDEKLVGGEGASLALDGIAVDLCCPIPTQTKLGVESDRRQWAHSTSWMVVMAWISAIWWYILSTPLVVSRGEALRGLAGGATSLA